MKNFISRGDTLTLTTPSGGVVSGRGFIIGGLFVVAQSTQAENELFSGLAKGVVELPKDGSTVFVEGQIVSWDKDTGVGEVVADGDADKDLDIGIAVETVISAKLTVKVLLTPRA